jgi:hypothetical protein
LLPGPLCSRVGGHIEAMPPAGAGLNNL